MYFGCFDFRGELGFLICDDVCMCVVNKQFELLVFVSAGSMCLIGVCSPVVVLGLSVMLSWYPISWVRLLR